MPKSEQDKVVPTVTRMLGHVPFRSIIASDGKGKYIASAKFNGKSYVGGGDSEGHATLDLRKQLDKAARESKVPSTRVLNYDDSGD